MGWRAVLTPLKHNSGSTLEVLPRSSNRGKQFLVGTVEVRVTDQIIVEGPVNDRFCSLFSSCKGEKDGGLHNCPGDPRHDRDALHKHLSPENLRTSQDCRPSTWTRLQRAERNNECIAGEISKMHQVHQVYKERRAGHGPGSSPSLPTPF